MKKIKSKIINRKTSSWDQFLTKLAVFVSILMIVGGAIGMIFVQKDLRKSQDLRQQASVDDGKVSVTMTSSNLSPNEQGKINFSINTGGVQTDGVQLTFNVVSDTLTTPPSFALTDTAPLQIAYSEIETTTDGYLISIIALPKQLGQPFSSITATPFGFLNVAPTSNGIITLNFDVENSISTVHASNPPKDELTHIATTDFVVGTTTIEVSPSPDASPDISPSPSASPIATPEVSPDSSPIATPEVSPTPTDDPGIGGNPDIATCNESCGVNADCDTNLRCYSGQCRLATNVSSATCSNPTDQGLNFSCNEYCADSNECASGLTCQSNKCRNPENVNSTTCSNLTSAQRNGVIRSCNESCNSNNDCDVNLRCYQGACRLATNPGSFSCSTSTKKTISKSVYGGTTAPKGSDDGSSQTGKTDPNKVVGEITIDSDKTMQKSAETDKMDKDGEVMRDDEESALDVIKEYFMANPKLPVILMGIGLGVIVAIIILALLKRKKDDNDQPPMPPVSSGTKPGGIHEKNLQDKINSLKKESIQMQGSSQAAPPMPPANPMRIPQNEPIKSDSNEIFSNQSKSSSMLDKLKNKDITPPGV
jgi:hypothetical protein